MLICRAMNISRTLRFFALGAAVLSGGCVAEASERPSADDGVADHAGREPVDGSDVLDVVGPWTVTATDGSLVTLTASSETLRPGPVTFGISVGSADGTTSPRSLDLVSPEMPIHGLLRREVVDGRVDIDLPMEGRWTVYVNLDDTGATTAEFRFNVPSGEAGGHKRHGGD
jgi:hypothetical protein